LNLVLRLPPASAGGYHKRETDIVPALAGPLFDNEEYIMSGHTFHEIYLHFNWHTKGDRPLLNPELKSEVHKFIRDRCLNSDGIYFHAIGGTATHVHLAVNIKPAVGISKMIGELKGACSFEMNRRAGCQVLDWQRGFGVISFGRQQLGWVKRYLDRQKEHHARYGHRTTGAH
jgi:REP element-mobilizing transposase RayT